MIHCKLTKIQSTHQKLRTDVIEGWCYHLPIVGEAFSIFSDPLDPEMQVRVVRTSTVVDVYVDRFETLNSTYELVVLQ
jgi:hypothetical protein